MIRMIVFALATAVAGLAAAQNLPSPDALRGAAQEQSGLLQQYREILRDPNADLRLSAFIQLAVVEDPVVRQMAYDEAFASTDSMLRSMALRYSLFDRDEFTIRYPGNSGEADTVRLRERNHANGDFRYSWGAVYSGRVQGLSVEMTGRGGCFLHFQLDDSDMLVGESNCGGTIRPVAIDLRG